MPVAAAAVPAAQPALADRVMQEFTLEEVATHNTEQDCWCIINGNVYDITEFLPDHPGGKTAPVLLSGGDATKEFNMLHTPDLLDKYGVEYLIGTCPEALLGEEEIVEEAAAAAPTGDAGGVLNEEQVPLRARC